VKVISPNTRPSAQITSPPIKSVRPLTPRKSTDDRSGMMSAASPPPTSTCACGGWLADATPGTAAAKHSNHIGDDQASHDFLHRQVHLTS
jgi:hypothetical protein